MAKQTASYLHVGINSGPTTFVNADGVTPKTIITADADDTDVLSLIATSDDTVSRDLKVILNNGSTDFWIGTVNIPIGSGTTSGASAPPSVDLLNLTNIPGLPLDSQGKRYIKLKGGWLLKVAPVVAVTSGKTITIVGMGDDF